jgi:hypothetical protein
LTESFIGGSTLFLLLLPFVALALWSPAYRPRFHAIFRLPGMDFKRDLVYSDSHIGDGEL